MKRFEGVVFEHFDDRSSGSLFSDIEFVKCRFLGCGFSSIDIANLDQVDLVGLRSIARRITFINCQADSIGFVGTGIVEDSIIDGLGVSKHLQTTGTAFKRVVIRGSIDKFMVTPCVDTFGHFPEVQRAFDDANREYYETVDWALDISEALFKDCDIRNIRAELIKRDNETQFVLTREKAMNGKWREIDLRGTHWTSAIELFLNNGDPSRVLVAPKNACNFNALLKGLYRLRDAGIVEQD